MVYLITGKQGAGKSEYALRLRNELQMEGNSVMLLDGDDFREMTKNQDFTDAGRIKNLMLAASMAATYEEQGNIVILAFIAPKKEWRDSMRAFWKKSRVIYIPGGKLWLGTEYETPKDVELDLITN